MIVLAPLNACASMLINMLAIRTHTHTHVHYYVLLVCHLCTCFARRDPAGGVGVVGGFKFATRGRV